MTVANARIAGANSDQARRLNRRQPKQYKLISCITGQIISKVVASH
jgi:hypothetical protein